MNLHNLTLCHAEASAHINISRLFAEVFWERYSLVIEKGFSCHGVDGCGNQREALDGRKDGSQMRS